jgi:uncharacterized membrane protein YphA (DoxX/SURF4 family)
VVSFGLINAREQSMNPQNKWLKIVGIVLNVLVAGMLIFAGSLKVFGSADSEMAQQFGKYGLQDHIQLIGYGELACALFLILPWTSPFGALMTSGFWGGSICLLMSHGENYTLNAALLVVTWIGAYLRGSVPLYSTKLQ